MFVVKRAVCVGRTPFNGGTSLLIRSLVTHHCLRSSKKRSPYSLTVSDRYSSLVKTVMSSRVSAQTPVTLQEEDEHIYGPILKAKTSPSLPETTREPKIFYPFVPEDKYPEVAESELGLPTRIHLRRGEGRSSAPSVTRILQQTLSPEQTFLLERWKRGMIQKLGEDGFKEYSQNLFRQGKLFHVAVDDILTSGTMQMSQNAAEMCPSDVQGYMTSISHILKDISAVRAVESTVQHDSLNYVGIVDCVARYRGVLCVIDWKTSEKQKPFLGNTYDNPVQVAAYAGALNSDKNYKYEVDHGLIVVAYKDGSPGHAHQLSSELMLQYWKTWLLRLEKFPEQR